MMLFYRALAQGAMAVVAPVTAVTSAAIPVVVGLVGGERPPIHQLMGVGCALVAIALVSLAPPPKGERIVVTPPLVARRCCPAPASPCSSCSSPWPGGGDS